MIAPLPPKFEPGERYGYSNAGFILLGLVVEAVSGLSYQQYVQDTVIAPCRMTHTGYYRMDALPPNTALGYMQDDETDTWRTNIFSLPVMGGSDGGLFTCAGDLDKLWRAIFANRLLSEDMTRQFLALQVVTDEENGESYGLGVYRIKKADSTVYYAVGGDSGVDFFTAYFPKTEIVISALGNTNVNTYPLLEKARALFT
jgi:CubicO group peptidase (beta-lactamase class C family)